VNDELEFLNAHSANVGGLQRALALAAVDDARADAADQRDQLERRAEAERRAEVLAWGNRQLGNPMGELSRFRGEYVAADDEVRDLAGRLERATKKRDRIGEAIRSRAQQLDEITASISRPAPVVDPANPFAIGLARAHHEFAEATRARWIEAEAARALAPRPKAGRGGVARALGDGRFDVPDCPECVKAGATEDESFLLHSDPDKVVPVPVPGDTDRSAVPYGQEITR
jgi:hypothetical protein